MRIVADYFGLMASEDGDAATAIKAYQAAIANLDDEERDTRALKYELVDIFAEGGLWAHASTEACSDSSRAGAGASSTGTRRRCSILTCSA